MDEKHNNYENRSTQSNGYGEPVQSTQNENVGINDEAGFTASEIYPPIQKEGEACGTERDRMQSQNMQSPNEYAADYNPSSQQQPYMYGGTQQQSYGYSPQQAYPYYSQQPQYDAGYYQTGHPAQPEYAPHPEKKKKTKGKAFLAASLCICVLASGALGFGGGLIATQLNDTGTDLNGESNEGMTIQRVVTTETDSGANGEMSTSEIVKTSADAVVEITTESVATGSFSRQYITSGAGSGVIISENGYIITNNHVIKGANKITVTLRNGEEYEAELIGSDSIIDCALLKIEETGLKAAVFGDSDKINVGEKCVAIGNPLGQLGGTVTDGIISALNRDLVIDDVTMNLMQTNAAINPGNSGGGLFDSQGKFIGLVVAKSSGSEIEGLGFAIPINDVVDILDDLTEYGYVRGRVQMGVSLLDIDTNQMAMMYGVDELGVYIQSVTTNSSADIAGLRRGDRITEINGKEISTSSELKAELSKCKVGDTVNIRIERSGSKSTKSVTLEEDIPDMGQSSDSDGRSAYDNH